MLQLKLEIMSQVWEFSAYVFRPLAMSSHVRIEARKHIQLPVVDVVHDSVAQRVMDAMMEKQ